jgi:hypothetical protein
MQTLCRFLPPKKQRESCSRRKRRPAREGEARNGRPALATVSAMDRRDRDARCGPRSFFNGLSEKAQLTAGPSDFSTETRERKCRLRSRPCDQLLLCGFDPLDDEPEKIRPRSRLRTAVCFKTLSGQRSRAVDLFRQSRIEERLSNVPDRLIDQWFNRLKIWYSPVGGESYESHCALPQAPA